MGREKEVQNGAAKRRGWDRTLGKMNIAQTTMNAHFKLRGRRALCTVSALSELVPDKSGGRVRPEIQREGHKCGQQRKMRGRGQAHARALSSSSPRFDGCKARVAQHRAKMRSRRLMLATDPS
jgi:hypothetical protein